VRSFAHMPLGISDRNKMVLWPAFREDGNTNHLYSNEGPLTAMYDGGERFYATQVF